MRMRSVIVGFVMACAATQCFAGGDDRPWPWGSKPWVAYGKHRLAGGDDRAWPWYRSEWKFLRSQETWRTSEFKKTPGDS
jgi:hypothetical protein